jgi:hypothetical protein
MTPPGGFLVTATPDKHRLALTRVAVTLKVPLLDALGVGVGSDGTSQHAFLYADVQV